MNGTKLSALISNHRFDSGIADPSIIDQFNEKKVSLHQSIESNFLPFQI